MSRTTNGKSVAAAPQTRTSRLQQRTGITAAVLATVFLATGAAQRAQGQSFKTLHSFTGPDGAYPYAGLIMDAAGNLYGTTLQGGDVSLNCYEGQCYGDGTVFKLDTSGKETVVHSFTGLGGDGAYPSSGLTIDEAGNLYGTTSYGGSSRMGTVFKVDSSGKETVLHSFAGTPDGQQPYAGLVMDKAGNLYGTTVYGGSTAQYGGDSPLGFGTVFMVDASGKETVLHIFGGPVEGGPGADGAFPSGLVVDKAGSLYGTTEGGGSVPCFFGCGSVFKLTPSGKETVLYSFKGSPDGAQPSAGPLMDRAGNLYGTTEFGGSAFIRDASPTGFGTVFKVDTAGNESVLHIFGLAEGVFPTAGLVMDTAGNLYGTTLYGTTQSGGDTYGTVFKLDTSGKETVLHNFTGPDGTSPTAGLLMDAAGDLYGTTSGGGSSNYGTVFKLTLSVPFAAFDPKLDITPRGFRLNGAFTPEAEAPPIDPATQGMRLKVGTYTVAVPAASFRAHPNRDFTYRGQIDGVRLEIRIAPAGADAYQFHVEASGVNLTRTTNPVPVTLTTPDQTGTAEVTVEFHFHGRPD